MDDKAKGIARAQGAVINFLADRIIELDRGNRSHEYRLAFWQELERQFNETSGLISLAE